MKYWRGYLALLGIVLCTGYTMLPVKSQTSDHVPFSEGILISHAGGGLKKGPYTNSLEALDKAVENGFTYIEVDFLTAKNGDLVLLHDWEEEYFRLFTHFPRFPIFSGISKAVRSKSASDFKSLSMQMGLTQLTLDELILWLSENPEIYIITDIKDANLIGLTQIRNKSGDTQNRFIPQIYSFDEYETVKLLGFKDIILTTYKLKTNVSDLSEFLKSNTLFALTVPERWVEDGIIASLPELDIPVLTHTINSPVKASALIEKGVGGIYTDYLYPAGPKL